VRDVQRRPFRIDPDGLRSIAEVVQVMELRTGVEVEAAGLAAERASVGSRRRIAGALSAVDAALGRGESAIEEDFAFHQAIASATENPHFMRFLEFLGRFLIPRQSVRIGLKAGKELRSYLERIQTEHRAIATAIEGADVPGARRAMRRHLLGSRQRYQLLAEQSARMAKLPLRAEERV
jgi:GntR family transcriptional regulator, transcriptional repressor for pyruvate dehydrogenase complex